MNLQDISIKNLKGIGEKKALAFERLGISSVYDLLSFYPRRYEDRSSFKPLALLRDGETACISAVAASEPRLVRVRRGMELVKLKIADESGIADITFFNQPYVKNLLIKGEEYNFYGRAEVNGSRVSLVNPLFEKSSAAGKLTGRIMPVYPLTKGINQKTIISSMELALSAYGGASEELLPEDIISKKRLCSASFALHNIHFPQSFEALRKAKRKLVFQELFVLSCALGRMKGRCAQETGIRLSFVDIEEFFSSLPFSPTGAQRRAVKEALADMESGRVMNRLLQGDVGSGKTLVAAALCFAAVKSGYTCALMAPTEILAMQHLETMKAFLQNAGIEVAALTGSMKAAEKKAVKNSLAAGEIGLIIGTHALLSEDVQLPRLALVITDEQHRFGVDQRAVLASKGQAPHVLVMSATPIPRTLALIIYGDLDLSILDEMPPGRQRVDTFCVDSSYDSRLNAFIKKQAEEGHRVFVVCPKVEEEEEAPSLLKSAEEHREELAAALPSLSIGCVHGRMKPKEKEEAMAAFVRGETQVLVSTTVIEVGVDVPEASLIIVRNAERFGLSQLHQLRGRVGRGAVKSFCVLVTDSCGEDVKARMKIMCSTNDGFKISEEDLRLRGPGDFFGSRQHGLPEMRIADLGADVNVLKEAQLEAGLLLERDPALSSCPALRERIDRLFIIS